MIDIENLLSKYNVINPKYVPWSIPQIVAHIQAYLDDNPIANAETLQAVIDAAWTDYLAEIDANFAPYIEGIEEQVDKASSFAASSEQSSLNALGFKNDAMSYAENASSSALSAVAAYNNAVDARNAAQNYADNAAESYQKSETIYQQISTYKLRGVYTAADETLEITFA